MGSNKTVNYNFTFSLFKKQSLPPIYQSLNNNRTGEQYINSEAKPAKTLFSNITEVKCIPEYLTPIHHKMEGGLKTLELHRVDGFYIDLTSFSSVDDYIGFKMGGKQRSRLKSRIKRLESCFNISYKVYFGHIEKEKYETLFNSMVLLLNKRFEQKKEEFEHTAQLDTIKENSYPLILDKKASFHVIYDGPRPIHICLNYHFQDILNGSFRCYDIDYAKFGLGHIDIVKHLEWCFDHNYSILDFMWGYSPYKHDWCNSIKQLRHHIFYNPKSLSQRILVLLRVSAYRFKDYMQARKNKKIKKSVLQGSSKKPTNTERFEVQEIDFDKEINKIHKLINIYEEPNLWLRPLVFNFQYKHREHTDNIAVHEMKNTENTYLVLGKNKAIKIVRWGK